MKLLLSIFLLLSVNAFAQDFDTMHYQVNFGNVTRTSLRLYDVIIDYRGKSATYVTKVEQAPELSHRINKKVFYPDSQFAVRVLVRPTKIGAFKYNLRVFIENQKDPLKIEVMGNVVEMPDFTTKWGNFIPAFEKRSFRSADTVDIEIRFLVKDAVTNQLLPNSDVAIIKNGIPISSWRTGLNGAVSDSIEAGFYYFFTQHQGYKTMETGIQIGPTIREIEIPLFLDTANCEKYVQTTLITKNNPSDESQRIKLEKENEELFDTIHHKPLNIIFLLDLSQSMNEKDRMSLMQYTLQQSIKYLRATDNVTFLGYSDKAGVIRPTISGDQKIYMRQLITELDAFGMSYAENGLQLALKIFKGKFSPESTNTLVLITDGAFNGNSRRYERQIKKIVANNIQMSIVGLKVKKDLESPLRRAATLGSGEYFSISKIAEGQNQLSELFKRQSYRARRM